jgi:hypothetical protein
MGNQRGRQMPRQAAEEDGKEGLAGGTDVNVGTSLTASIHTHHPFETPKNSITERCFVQSVHEDLERMVL